MIINRVYNINNWNIIDWKMIIMNYRVEIDNNNNKIETKVEIMNKNNRNKIKKFNKIK